MSEAPPLSEWAHQRFGEHTDEVRQALAQALVEAMNDAQDAQRSSRSDKQYAYGSTLMARRYETIVAMLGSRSDVQVIKPHASPHELTVVDGNLLFPFRYSKDGRTPIGEARISDRRVSGLIRELFRRFSPEPTYEQEALELFADEEAELAPLRPALAELPDDTHLVLVAYAGNAQAGLFNVYWGEAELIDEFGRIRWIHHEPLPLLVPSAYSGRHLVATGYAEEDPAARFDEVPGVPMTTRSPIEREGGEALSAYGEPTGDVPASGADERR
jgi:hypothetical protein